LDRARGDGADKAADPISLVRAREPGHADRGLQPTNWATTCPSDVVLGFSIPKRLSATDPSEEGVNPLTDPPTAEMQRRRA
jgi:hypothetical protein